MSKSVILPPATLGMLGGGQLGRFFVLAAHELGYKVWVLDPDTNSPAGKAADRHLCAAYEDFAWKSNPRLVPLFPRHGGHVGFHGVGSLVPWHDRCMAQFFARLAG